MSRSREELCRRLRSGLQIRSEIGDDGDLGCKSRLQMCKKVGDDGEVVAGLQRPPVRLQIVDVDGLVVCSRQRRRR